MLENFNAGHRKRAKEKFLKQEDIDNIFDYELLELILFYSVPRVDVKPLAKKLLANFGSLSEVLLAKAENLKPLGVSENTIILFKLMQRTNLHILKKKVEQKPVLSNWQQLIDYCYLDLAHETKEIFKVVYLNSKNILIKDEVLGKGTINEAAVYPREIITKALNLGSTSIILVHNHPSGNSDPSSEDITTTLELKQIGKSLNIAVHDHLIISKNGITSFKKLGLL